MQASDWLIWDSGREGRLCEKCARHRGGFSGKMLPRSGRQHREIARSDLSVAQNRRRRAMVCWTTCGPCVSTNSRSVPKRSQKVPRVRLDASPVFLSSDAPTKHRAMLQTNTISASCDTLFSVSFALGAACTGGCVYKLPCTRTLNVSSD